MSYVLSMAVYTVGVKKIPLRFSDFFHKRLGINQLFTHVLYVPFYTRLEIFIQLFPTFTKLCHTKHHHPANYLHFTRTLTSKLAYRANDVTVDVMSYTTSLLTLWKCCVVSCHRQ